MNTLTAYQVSMTRNLVFVLINWVTMKQEIKYYMHNVYIYVHYGFIQPNIEKDDYYSMSNDKKIIPV